ARQYFESNEDQFRRNIKEGLDRIGIPYSDIYIGKKPPAHFFVDDRTIPPFDGDWEMVKDIVLDKNKKINKSADDQIKNTKNFHGLEIDIEWPKGSIRSYKGDDTYVTHMKCDYGYVRNIEGADGD